MEVPVINRISDFDLPINDTSFLSRAFDGKLHHACSGFLKWGALLLIALLTTLATRIESLVLRLRNGNVSLPSPTLLYDYDEYDSDSSCSSDSSDDDDQDDDDDDDKEDDSVNGRVRGGSGHNIPWLRRCSDSFGDLLSWPDLGGLGSSGVVKLWDHLDIHGEGSHRGNAVGSFFGKCGAVEAVEVSSWDARAGFKMPALVAEWRPPGRLFGKMVRVNDGDVDKIYVGGEITVGDMRMVNGALLTEPTESDVVTMVRRRRRH